MENDDDDAAIARSPTPQENESASASLRLEVMLEKQRMAREAADAKLQEQKETTSRLGGVKRGLKSFGSALNRMNPGKWIDDLERDQEIAYRLEEMNRENEEEEERQRICREAEAACLEAVRDHLGSFLAEKPEATYEEWIVELHPENARTTTTAATEASSRIDIDHRFYVHDSDHRMLWNENLPEGSEGDGRRRVPAISMEDVERRLAKKPKPMSPDDSQVKLEKPIKCDSQESVSPRVENENVGAGEQSAGNNEALHDQNQNKH